MCILMDIPFPTPCKAPIALPPLWSSMASAEGALNKYRDHLLDATLK